MAVALAFSSRRRARGAGWMEGGRCGSHGARAGVVWVSLPPPDPNDRKSPVLYLPNAGARAARVGRWRLRLPWRTPRARAVLVRVSLPRPSGTTIAHQEPNPRRRPTETLVFTSPTEAASATTAPMESLQCGVEGRQRASCCHPALSGFIIL